MKQIQLFNCMIKSELKNLNVSASRQKRRSKENFVLLFLSPENQVEKLKNFSTFFRHSSARFFPMDSLRTRVERVQQKANLRINS